MTDKPDITQMASFYLARRGIVHDGARPETGPMQFDNDWPGVFIRGDNAMHFAMNLKALLQSGVSAELWPAEAILTGLVNLLVSCCTNKAMRERIEMPPFTVSEKTIMMTPARKPYQSRADVHKLVQSQALLALRVGVVSGLTESTASAIATSIAIRVSTMLMPEAVDKPTAPEHGVMSDEIRRAT